MLEAVLAGVDPRQPAIDQLTGQPLTIEELLRRRGFIATPNMNRVVPLQNDPAISPPAVSAGPTVAAALAGGDVNARPDVATTSTNAETLPIAAEELDKLSDDDVNKLDALLAGMGIAGGSALAAYLMQRRGKRGSSRMQEVAETVADVREGTGEVREGMARQTPVDAEYYPIDPQDKVSSSIARNRLTKGEVATGPAKLQGGTKQKELDRPQGKLRGSTRAERQAGRGSPNLPTEQSRIRLTDELTDLSDDEINKAWQISAAIAAQRNSGRFAAGRETVTRVPDPQVIDRTVPMKNVPAIVDENETLGIFNTVVDAIRKNRGAMKALPRMAR